MEPAVRTDERLDPAPAPRKPRYYRAICFVVGAILLQVSPFAVQVGGVRNIPLVMGWRMYRVRGSDACVARFDVVDGGVSRRIRLAAVKRPGKSYRIRIHEPEQARWYASQMCAEIPPEASLTFSVDCGHRTRGWVRRVDQEPACTSER